MVLCMDKILSSDENSIYNEREGDRVIQSRQDDSRDCKKEISMYLREVCYILKKEGVNHGIAKTMTTKSLIQNNEKSTQDYKL